MVEMSTDKAVVELPSPVSGKVVSLGGEPGDQIAVGGELIVLETDAERCAAAESAPAAARRCTCSLRHPRRRRRRLLPTMATAPRRQQPSLRAVE